MINVWRYTASPDGLKPFRCNNHSRQDLQITNRPSAARGPPTGVLTDTSHSLCSQQGQPVRRGSSPARFTPARVSPSRLQLQGWLAVGPLPHRGCLYPGAVSGTAGSPEAAHIGHFACHNRKIFSPISAINGKCYIQILSNSLAPAYTTSDPCPPVTFDVSPTRTHRSACPQKASLVLVRFPTRPLPQPPSSRFSTQSLALTHPTFV